MTRFPLSAALLSCLLLAPLAAAGDSDTNYLVHVDVATIHVVGVGTNPTTGGDLVDVSVSSGPEADCDGSDVVDITLFSYEGANPNSDCANPNDDDDSIDVAVVSTECGDRRDTVDVNLFTPDNC